MQSVFFYGLFMDESLLKEKGLNPSKPVVAYADGYGLRIGERATLIKSEGERAYGSIMSLNDQELEVLYGDKSVEDYISETISATTKTGKSLDVLCYNLPLEMLSGQNQEYAKALADVAEKKGLPPNYVDEIQRWTR